MKKRILRIICVLLVFLVTLIPAIYLNSIYGYFPILFLTVMFVISICCMNRIRNHIAVEMDMQNGECERGRSVSIGLGVRNRTNLLCPKVLANLFISDLFGEEDEKSQTCFTLAPMERTDLGFDMDMPHIGIYHLGIEDMDIYDFFGVFRRNVSIKENFEVYVKPRILPMEELPLREIATAETERNTRTTVMSGMDYVGVREYAAGDSMKQIHWKLSAHSLDYMTKLHESNRQTDFAVIVDFAAQPLEDREVLMDLYDALIETSLSLIDEISRYHTSYSLIYCNKDREIQKMTPKGREDDLTLIKDFSVITPEPPVGYPDGAQILIEEGNMANRSSNVILCTSRVTEELIQELLRVRQQQRSPELYQIVPAGLNSRELSDLQAKLGPLDEADIHHCFVYTTDVQHMEGGMV